MIKNTFLLFLIGLSVLLTSGCATTSSTEGSTPAEMSEEHRAEARKIGQKYGEIMIKSLQDNDYVSFIAKFTPDTRKEFTKATFEALRKNLGEIKNVSYLTSLKSPLFETYVWKITLEREVKSDTEQKKLITGEALLRLTVMLEGKEYYIVSWNIQ